MISVNSLHKLWMCVFFFVCHEKYKVKVTIDCGSGVWLNTNFYEIHKLLIFIQDFVIIFCIYFASRFYIRSGCVFIIPKKQYSFHSLNLTASLCLECCQEHFNIIIYDFFYCIQFYNEFCTFSFEYNIWTNQRTVEWGEWLP